jgi:hypothetical protein
MARKSSHPFEWSFFLEWIRSQSQNELTGGGVFGGPPFEDFKLGEEATDDEDDDVGPFLAFAPFSPLPWAEEAMVSLFTIRAKPKSQIY